MSEHGVNSFEDYLIDGLSCKMPTQNDGCPNCSASYSPASGAGLIRVNRASSNEWLDPQSVRVSYTIHNNDGNVAHLLRTIGDPSSSIGRLRVVCGGVCVEDIQDRCQ